MRRNGRMAAVAAILLLTAATLAACTPAPTVVEGSRVTVAVATPFTSVNAGTSYGRSTPTNADVAYLTGTGFGYYDDAYRFVPDASFGTAEVVSADPFTVRYTVADGATWSDGAPVDAADLLLSWAANSGVLNTPDFDDDDYVDPATGQYTEDFPDDVVFFDGTIGSGLELATATPSVVADRAIEVVYDDFLPTWRQAIAPGVPAHIVAERALPGAGADDDDPADRAQAAKEALVAAIVGRDAELLPALARTWNTAFTVGDGALDDDLVVASGPYRIAEVDETGSVVLEANPVYRGSRQPTYEEIVLRVSPDPLESVDLLARGEVDIVTPQPTEDVLAALVEVDGVSVTAGSEGTFEHLDLQFAQSRSGTFDDVRVREAFLRVVPRQQILDDLIVPLQQDAGLLDSFTVRPGADGYEQTIAANGSRDFAETDVEAAVDLLAEAGVVAPRVCMLYDPANPRRVAEFTLIRTSAARAGFQVTDCSAADWESLLGVAGAYDAALFAWDTTRLGPAAASAVFRSDSQLANFTHYDNPEVDELIDQLDATDDDGEVTQLLSRIDALIWADAYGVPLFAYPTVTAVSSSVGGVSRSPLGRGVFWNAWDWAPVSATAAPE